MMASCIVHHLIKDESVGGGAEAGFGGIRLARVEKRLAARGLKLELTDAAAALVASHGYDPVYGARPLKRAIQRAILDPLSMAILSGKFPEGSTIRTEAEDGRIVFR